MLNSTPNKTQADIATSRQISPCVVMVISNDTHRREALKALVSSRVTSAQVGAYETGSEGFLKAVERTPELLIIDVTGQALMALALLRTLWQHVVGLTVHFFEDESWNPLMEEPSLARPSVSALERVLSNLDGFRSNF